MKKQSAHLASLLSSLLDKRQAERYTTTVATKGGILYYDGHCGLCNWSATFLMRHDRKRTLRYAPLQGDTAFHQLPEEYRLNLSTVIYQQDEGQLYARSGAILRALIDSGSRLGYLAKVALYIPRWPRDKVYNLIARNRHRLFKHDSCQLPDANQRSQMLP